MKISKVLFILFLLTLFPGSGQSAEIKQGVVRIRCDQVSNNDLVSSFNATTYVGKIGDRTTFSKGGALFVSYSKHDVAKAGAYVQPFKRVEFSLTDQNVLVINAIDFSYLSNNSEEFIIKLNLAGGLESDNGSITRISTYQYARGQFEDNGATDPVGEPLTETKELGKFSC